MSIFQHNIVGTFLHLRYQRESPPWVICINNSIPFHKIYTEKACRQYDSHFWAVWIFWCSIRLGYFAPQLNLAVQLHNLTTNTSMDCHNCMWIIWCSIRCSFHLIALFISHRNHFTPVCILWWIMITFHGHKYYQHFKNTPGTHGEYFPTKYCWYILTSSLSARVTAVGYLYK